MRFFEAKIGCFRGQISYQGEILRLLKPGLTLISTAMGLVTAKCSRNCGIWVLETLAVRPMPWQICAITHMDGLVSPRSISPIVWRVMPEVFSKRYRLIFAALRACSNLSGKRARIPSAYTWAGWGVCSVFIGADNPQTRLKSSRRNYISRHKLDGRAELRGMVKVKNFKENKSS